MATTTGLSVDADGYTARLGERSVHVPANGSATFDDVTPGAHTVELAGVAPNCDVSGGAERVVQAAVNAVADVSFEVDCLFDAAGITLEQTVCPSLAPAANQGMPLDVVPIGVLPSTLERPVLARMSWDGGPEVTYGFSDEEGGTAELMIPIHPSGSVQGGNVTVRIADDARTCPPFTFSILPLPLAPGELAALASILADDPAAAGGWPCGENAITLAPFHEPGGDVAADRVPEAQATPHVHGAGREP